MDIQDLRTLKLIETIDGADKPPSQRDMARSLNISLGLVNSFLKRLVKKGYFKITHLPRNRVGYILTPQGATEKSRLTYNYIQYSYRFYKEARKRFHEVFQKLAEEGCQRVAFYGAGDLAEIGFISIQGTGLQFCGVADNDKDGERILGLTILSVGELKKVDVDKVVITVSDHPSSAADYLKSVGIPINRIQSL